MSVLVTGGAGFIGSHLVDRLLKEGFDVIVLDNLYSGKIENLDLENRRISFFRGDVCDEAIVGEVLRRDVNVVFHLAAIIDVQLSIEKPMFVNHVNVCGSLNVLKKCVENDVERFIFASSCAVYGEPKYLPINEEHPLDPLSPYAVSKLAVEKLCRIYSRLYGLKTVSLRLFNVYGPRQESASYSGVITQMIRNLRAGKPPVIFGDGSQTRDFVYVLDVVDAFMKAMESEQCCGEINIGSGKETSINELAEILMEKFNLKNIKPIYMKPRLGDIKRSCADIEKAKHCLGYKTKFSLNEGLDLLLERSALCD